MYSRAKNIIKIIVGLLIAALIFYFMFKRIAYGWEGIAPHITSVNWFLMIVGVLVIEAGLMMAVPVWMYLASKLYNIHVPIRSALAIVFLPQASKYIPGKIWFLFGTVYMAKKLNIDSQAALTVLIILQLVHLVGAFSFGALIILLTGATILPAWVFAVFAVLCIVIMFPGVIHKIIGWGIRFGKKDTKVDIKIPVLKPGYIIIPLLLNICLWFLIGAGTLIAASSFIPDVKIGHLFTMSGTFSIAYAVGYISMITPAGLGVREGVFAAMLSPLYGETTASVIAIGARIWLTIAEFLQVVIAVALFGFRRLQKLSAEFKKNRSIPED